MAPAPSGITPPAGVASGSSPAPGGGSAQGIPDNRTAPTFDVVRVEPTGESVIAGRAAPGAAVDLLDNGKPYSRVMADASGLFAIVPPELAVGTHEIVLQTIAPDGTRARSNQSVTVVIAAGRNQQPLVTVSAPDQPTVILSRPDEPRPAVATNGSGQAQTQGQGASPGSTVPSASTPLEAPAQGQAGARPTPRPGVRIASVDSEGDRLYVSGIAAPGSTLRLYLNDFFVAPGATGPDGRLAFTIGKGVRPGEYRVRLDDVDPVSGAVRSRVEVPFTVPEPAIAMNAPPPDAGASAGGRAGNAVSGGGATAGNTQANATQARGSVAVPAPGAASAARPSGSPALADRGATPLASGGAPNQDSARPGTSPPAVGNDAAAGPRRIASAPRGTSDSGSDVARLGTDPGQVLVPEVNTAIVARGDNLWRISKRTYGAGLRYTVIFGANSPQIRNPDLIYPGQLFVLPVQSEVGGQR